MGYTKKIISPLQKGDVVALINPANPLPERFANQERYVVEYLQRMGFQVKNYIIKDNWQDPCRRRDNLMACFTDNTIKAIFPICGGESVYDIIPLLDYYEISKNNKIISGYSFISTFLISISEKAKIETFCSPHLNFLNDRSSQREMMFSVWNFWAMLSDEKVAKKGMSGVEKALSLKKDRMIIENIYNCSNKIQQEKLDNLYIPGEIVEDAEGITCIASLQSLKRLEEINLKINYKNKLLFLDTLDEDENSICDSINFLVNNTNFIDASALIFSSFCNRRTKQEINQKFKIETFKFLHKISQKYNIKKVFYGFPLGHCNYKMTVPNGIYAKFIASTGQLCLKEQVFASQNIDTFLSNGIQNKLAR